MYSIDRAKNIEVISAEDKYLGAGIHENVTVQAIRTGISPQGFKFIEITFENENGATARCTKYEPKTTKRDRNSGQIVPRTPEEIQASCDTQYGQFLQLLSCYYSKEQLTFNGESFGEFANWVVSTINSADKSKKLRVKLVFDGNSNYVNLPTYARYTFIEPMDVEKSMVTKLNIDVFDKPVITADKETKVESDPLETPAQPTTNTADLPF